jgi:hypothetical protein
MKENNKKKYSKDGEIVSIFEVIPDKTENVYIINPMIISSIIIISIVLLVLINRNSVIKINKYKIIK